MNVHAGDTDVIQYFKLVDSLDGTPKTGLTITDLDMSYVRDQAVAIKADATAHNAPTDAHADNKMIEVDIINTPGLYRADFPDAAFAANSDKVQLCINGADIDPAYQEIELTLFDPQDIVAGVFGYAGICADGTTTFAVVQRDLYARHVLTASRSGDVYTFKDTDGTALYTGTIASASWTKGAP